MNKNRLRTRWCEVHNGWFKTDKRHSRVCPNCKDKRRDDIKKARMNLSNLL